MALDNIIDFRAFAFTTDVRGHIEVALHKDQDQQLLWLRSQVVSALWGQEVVADRDHNSSQWKQSTSAISNQHAAIWPGVEFPEASVFHITGSSFTYWIPTSVVLAATVECMSNTKRKVIPRQRAHLILTQMIDAVAMEGLEITVQHVRVDGTMSRHTITVGRDGCVANSVGELWDAGFWNQLLAFYWVSDLNSDQKPWVRTPQGKQHVADYIAFILDVSRAERVRVNKDMVAIKKYYSSSALDVVSQVAFALDSLVRKGRCTEALTGEISKGQGVRAGGAQKFGSRVEKYEKHQKHIYKPKKIICYQILVGGIGFFNSSSTNLKFWWTWKPDRQKEDDFSTSVDRHWWSRDEAALKRCNFTRIRRKQWDSLSSTSSGNQHTRSN